MSKLAGRCQTRMRDDRYLTTTQCCGKGWHGHSTPPAWPANSWDYTIVRTRFAAAALLSGLNNKSVRFRRRVVVMGYLWPQGRSARGLTPAYRVSTGRDKQGYYTFKVEIRVRACARGLLARQLFSTQPDYPALRNMQPSMNNNTGWLDGHVITASPPPVKITPCTIVETKAILSFKIVFVLLKWAREKVEGAGPNNTSDRNPLVKKIRGCYQKW